MSAVNATDPLSKTGRFPAAKGQFPPRIHVHVADAATYAAAKKKRKNKKKANDKAKDVAADAIESNGIDDDDNGVDVDDAEADQDAQQPSERHPSTSKDASVAEGPSSNPPAPTDASPESSKNHPQQEKDAPPAPPQGTHSPPTETLPLRNGTHPSEEKKALRHQPQAVQSDDDDDDDDDNDAVQTTVRLQEMATERNDLQAEVAKLRTSLESIQEKHQGELTGLREEVEDAQSAKENAESQYRTLLGKVNTIRSQLGERLKADAEELSQARSHIEELQDENRAARESNKELHSTIARLQADMEHQGQEIATLTSRTSTLQTTWAKERDELAGREAFAREEFESARQAMQDWEVLAMEERSLRETLGDKVAELEDQLNSQREAYARVADDRDVQSSTIDGLQSALQEIQEARRRELRELVENSQSQLNALRAEAEAAKTAAATSATDLESAQKELERLLPFEKEVKEKNLLIGKLRHEAVILNDHLTKALRFLKRGKPEDNVDRQIVTNHFLHFLMLDRSDPKKFQVLQLIAALLGWDEEQRERAGLARPGASNSALRVPLSPFRRTPSTPTLSSDFMPEGSSGSGSKESLAELWSEFLDREAQEGKGGLASRANSVAGHGIRSPLSPTSERQAPGLGISKTGTWGSSH